MKNRNPRKRAQKKKEKEKEKEGGFEKRGFVKWVFFLCFWSCLPRQGYYCV
jgi:hypothetical protein